MHLQIPLLLATTLTALTAALPLLSPRDQSVSIGGNGIDYGNNGQRGHVGYGGNGGIYYNGGRGSGAVANDPTYSRGNGHHISNEDDDPYKNFPYRGNNGIGEIIRYHGGRDAYKYAVSCIFLLIQLRWGS